jgi:hypothetical protein
MFGRESGESLRTPNLSTYIIHRYVHTRVR